MSLKPTIFVGDRFTNKVGSECEVIEYNGANKIKIRFLDDLAHEKSVSSRNLRLGSFYNPNTHSGKGKKVSVKIGQTFETNSGGVCKVIKYVNSKNVTVEFCDKYAYKATCTTQQLREGCVRNVYARTMVGVGFIGEGDYGAKDGNRASLAHRAWSDMFSRVYRDFAKEFYKDCTICKEWHNFQNFAKWYVNQKGYGLGYELDKDLLVKGNKIYSPETCCLVPVEINLSIVGSRSFRGDYPVGVTKMSRGGGYVARISKFGNPTYLGSYSNPKEAFLHFKSEKEAYLKELAIKYKDTVSVDVYEALCSYKVEIND